MAALLLALAASGLLLPSASQVSRLQRHGSDPAGPSQHWHRTLPASALPPLAALSVKQFGAVGDGVADDLPAFTAALAAAAAANGSVVHAPAGSYLIKGALTIPNGCSLQGVFTTVASHHLSEGEDPGPHGPGTFLFPEPDAKDLETAFITVSSDATLCGVSIWCEFTTNPLQCLSLCFPYYSYAFLTVDWL